MKKIVIITGPQGSGNHLFSKVFAENDQVGSWKGLTEKFWEGHHYEPFHAVWRGDKQLQMSDLDGYDYWVTSVSIPILVRGDNFNVDIVDFYNQAQALGIDVQIGVITRDKNVLFHQQTRVRGMSTIDNFMQEVDRLDANRIPYHFLSHESLALHGARYANYVMRLFGYPEIADVDGINEAANHNSNAKYFAYVDEHWLDQEIVKAREESKTWEPDAN